MDLYSTQLAEVAHRGALSLLLQGLSCAISWVAAWRVCGPERTADARSEPWTQVFLSQVTLDESPFLSQF